MQLVSFCVVVYIYGIQWLHYFLNVDSNKTQKPGATASPDLPDPQQAAVPVRTTHGCAAGMYSIHVHVQVLRQYI